MQAVVAAPSDIGAQRVRTFDVREHGARLDGTTDDGDAFRAAIASATDAGGGCVVWPGSAGLTGDLDIPTGVTLWGAAGDSHSSAGKIVALDATARVRFGEQLVGSYGGVSGNVLLDGAGLSPCMLYLGRTLQRTFHNVAVVNCAHDAAKAAVMLEESQNNRFFGLYLDGHAGTGLSFDRGAAGNYVYGLESASAGASGGYHVKFTATEQSVADGGTLSGVAEYPSNNHVFGGIAERDGGALDAVVYHGAGADNAFWGFNPSLSGVSRQIPILLMEVGDAAITTQSTRLSFWGGIFSGNVAASTLFDLDDGSIVYVYGNPLIQGFLNQYLLRDTLSKIYRVGYTGVPAPSGVTNTIAAGSAGTISQEQDLHASLNVTGLSAIHQTVVNGDSNNLFTIEKGIGTDLMGVNSNAGIVSLVNGADFHIYSDNYATVVSAIDGATGSRYFGPIGTATVADLKGAGSPEGVVTAPVGSTYRRTDGGAVTSFYVKESGTGNTGWVGK